MQIQPWQAQAFYPTRRQMLAGAFTAPFMSGFLPAAANQMYQLGAKLPGKIMNYTPSYYNKKKSSSYKSASMGGSYSSSSRRYGRRKYRRRRKYKKKVNRSTRKYIKKVVDNAGDTSTVVHRNISSSQISCEANECSYSFLSFLDHSSIEGALDQAKILDPNAGTLTEVEVDLNTIDGLKVKIINAKAIRTFRNNGQTPCNLECYYLFAKKRMGTAVTPLTILEDGLENAGITTNELTDLRFNVYDSKSFNDFFRIMRVKKYRVNAGDEVEIQLNRRKPFIYDPDIFDDHSASSKQPKIYQAVLVRMSGVVSHDDTTTTNVGTCNATLDYMDLTHIKYSVSSNGLRLKNLVVGASGLDAQTTPKVNIEDVAEVAETL